VVYASAPISKVIGEFDIADILHEDLDLLWKETSRYAGIDKKYFDQYFTDREMGYAIRIHGAKLYKDELSIQEHFGIAPPQSFAYVGSTFIG